MMGFSRPFATVELRQVQGKSYLILTVRSCFSLSLRSLAAAMLAALERSVLTSSASGVRGCPLLEHCSTFSRISADVVSSS